MNYTLIDRVLSLDATPAQGQPATLTAIKALAASEEYLQDHFPTFPVMPGVLMVEAAVQACRKLAEALAPDPAAKAQAARLVLAEAKAIKFAGFVTPGDTLHLEVSTNNTDPKALSNPTFKIAATIHRPGAPEAKAFAGKITLRPLESHTTSQPHEQHHAPVSA